MTRIDHRSKARTRASRIISLAFVIGATLVLEPVPAQAFVSCDTDGSTPNISKVDGGYYVNNWGTIRCTKPVKALYVSVWLTRDGVVVSDASNYCYGKDRCPAANIVYQPCNATTGKCQPHEWATYVYGWFEHCNDAGDCKKEKKPRRQRGRRVQGPTLVPCVVTKDPA